MSVDRLIAVVLLLVAFAALTVSKAAPFLDDLAGPVRMGVVVVGVASGLTGVWLWLRRSPR
ncbi:hypothetical protein [Micromonospora sp. NPDC092111]|uniref:hypothetical protein n=1 Tax=Micromonospora sp. NPDC092111 TaxID=3364289 RepID=UPI003801FD32